MSLGRGGDRLGGGFASRLAILRRSRRRPRRPPRMRRVCQRRGLKSSLWAHLLNGGSPAHFLADFTESSLPSRQLEASWIALHADAGSASVNPGAGEWPRIPSGGPELGRQPERPPRDGARRRAIQDRRADRRGEHGPRLPRRGPQPRHRRGDQVPRRRRPVDGPDRPARAVQPGDPLAREAEPSARREGDRRRRGCRQPVRRPAVPLRGYAEGPPRAHRGRRAAADAAGVAAPLAARRRPRSTSSMRRDISTATSSRRTSSSTAMATPSWATSASSRPSPPTSTTRGATTP